MIERRVRSGRLTWRARWRGPDGKERSRSFEKKRDAENHLASVVHSKTQGEYVDPARGRQTVGEWSTAWRAGRVHLKPSTLASYDSLLKTQIRPTWENVPLSRVANADVVAWVASMREGGLSASRVRQAYHLFAAMLDDAMRDRRLSVNAAAGVKLPRMPKPEDRYLTHDELGRLAGACGDYRSLVLVLGYTGLRWGEAAALRVGRVDPLRGRLDIAEAMTEVNGRVVFGVPKTHQRRSVPVPGFLRAELARACEGKTRDDHVFAGPRGGVYRVGAFRRQHFDAACVNVGLGAMVVVGPDDKKAYRGLTPHGLRHAAASFAIASGASVKGVQSMLGHASATLTLDRYGALFDDQLDAVAERIDAAARSAAKVSRPQRGPAPAVRLVKGA